MAMDAVLPVARCDAELAERLERYASGHERTMADVIREAVQQFLDREADGGDPHAA